MIFDFSDIKHIRGVDGYLVFDHILNVIDHSLDDELYNLQLKNLFLETVNNHRGISNLQTSILLTEQGVVVIAALPAHYLMIFAGYRVPVDVSKLSSIIDMIRRELESLTSS